MYEYEKMAKYYDLFYKNKSYDKEVKFLVDLISNRKSILDVGCGTGIHMNLLEEKGYKVDGIDLNHGMLDIAKQRVKGKLFEGDLLNFKIDKKYDVIISMFAVFNHLQNYEEFEQGIINCYQKLNKDGLLIIDLHNGRSSGKKENKYKEYKRIMSWHFNRDTFKEYTEINYVINNKIYHDTHEFMIYKLCEIKKILNKNNMHYKIYENYSTKIATEESKNIEIIIYKC